MPKSEIFPNPTVRQVVFQIRYPNLFYLESKIGEFQFEIMEIFPESSLIYRKPLLFTNLGPNVRFEDIANINEKTEGTTKIWQFLSPKNFKLNIQNDSLDISSEYHKTYDNKDSENRFRDIISLVLKNFFKCMKLPMLQRVGLRYIDECPLPKKDTETFSKYYFSALNQRKFKIEEISDMTIKTVLNRGDYQLRYAEALQKNGDDYCLILDFDGFANAVKPEDCLRVTDELHSLLISEYFSTIRKPVIEYMRNKQRDS